MTRIVIQTARPHHSVPVGSVDKTLETKLAAAHAYLYQTRNVAYLQMNVPVPKLPQTR